MSKVNYDKKRMRKAMLLAPAAGVIGLLPFIFQLNLSFGQFMLVIGAILLVSYLLGLIVGAPGYWLLQRLGYADTKFLLGYAAALVALTPILLSDVYALLVFGPPTLLVAGAFCWLRGPALAANDAPA